MQKNSCRVTVLIKPEFCIVLALTLLILPLRWVIAWLCASAFHELCHYAALRLSGCKVFRIQVDLNGAVMETDILRCSREVLCAMAGPAGGFALLIVARWFPRLAICSCFQALYNLIPIFPLDGGRAVSCVLRKLFSDNKSWAIQNGIENAVLFAVLVLGLYASFVLKLGVIPLLFSGVLIFRNKKIKTSCKERLLRVK